MKESRPFPGFWFAVLLCAIVIAVQSVSVVPFAVLGMLINQPQMFMHPAVIGFANLLAFAVALGAGYLLGRVPARDWLPVRRVHPAVWPAAVVMCVGAVLVLSEADNLVRLVWPPSAWVQKLFGEMFQPGKHPVGMFLLLVVVAPLTEELLFRGMILHGFRARFRRSTAILGSAFLFAALHLNPWQFVSALLLGVIFGWWLVRTRCLWLCLLGHAVANACVFSSGFLPFEVEGFNSDPTTGGTVFQPWWLDLLGLTLLLGGAWVFRRLTPPVPEPPAPPPEVAEPLPPVLPV